MYCAHGEALSRLRTVSVRWVAFCNAMMASSEFGKNGSEKHYENILSFWKAAVGAFWSLQIDGCSPYGCHWTLHSWHWAVSKRKTPGKNKYSQWGVTDTSGVWGIPSAEWSFVFKQTNERCFMNCKVRRLLNQNNLLLFTFVLFLCRSSCWNRQWMPEFAVWFSGLLPLWRMTADFWSFSLLHLAEQASFHALYLQFASCVNNPWSEICYTSLTLPITSES